MSAILSAPVRAAATTFCSIFLLWGAGAHADAPTDELALVRGFIDSPGFRAEVEANAHATAAAGTGPALFENPELQGRHEDAKGPAGSTTDAIGAALTVDLGFATTGHRKAAALRGQAGAYRERAAAIERVCGFRGEVLDLWAAQEGALVSMQAHDRLEDLSEQTTALAEAGDVPGYDRDRASLVLVTHWRELSSALALWESQKTRVEALSDTPATYVELAPTVDAGPLPALLEAALQSPELVALRLESEAAEQELAATRRETIPDLEVYGGARWDDQVQGTGATRGYEVGAALELPIFDVGGAQRAEASALLASAQALLTRRERELLAQVEAAWGVARSLDVDLPVLAPDTLWSAATERYFANEGGIGALVDLADDLESAELSAVRHATSLRRAHLDLSCSVGAFTEPTLQSALEDSLR